MTTPFLEMTCIQCFIQQNITNYYYANARPPKNLKNIRHSLGWPARHDMTETQVVLIMAVLLLLGLPVPRMVD